MYKYREESLYIAGPECFYPDGFTYLAAMRREAQYYGFEVALPNDNPLKLDHEDPQKNADAIFENCRVSMNASTAIIADLESFRGTEPDGGTIFEIGMAYARGLRCYAYTRDKRDTVQKYQGLVLKDGQVYDRENRVFPYADLPFSPCIVSTCKIIEGDFGDCLKVMMLDIDEERKTGCRRSAAGPAEGGDTSVNGKPARTRPLIYLSGPERYDTDAEEKYRARKEICNRYGYDAVSPPEAASKMPGTESDDPYARAYHTFTNWQQQVRDCDILIADLNDFHGMEPNSDVSFECGMAWQLGKQCFGYMEDTAAMRKRIPHYGEERGNKDICGNEVENFNYPINLMFASSMPVYEGDFETVLKQISEVLKNK